MNLLERVTSEYSQLEGTEFWKLYLAGIEDYRKSRGVILESCGVSEVPGIQGEIRALKFLAELPYRIIQSLAANTK